MTIVPACCDARYEAIDELVAEIRQRAPAAPPDGGPSTVTGGIDVANVLMVKVWDYLKGEPHADIETMVREQLTRRVSSEVGCCLSRILPPAADSQIIDDARSDLNHMLKNLCKETCQLAGDQPTIQLRCETTPGLSSALRQSSNRSQRPVKCQSKESARSSTGKTGGAEPITSALRNIKEAQKYDSNCAWKLHDLLTAEERITAHVKRLEARELQGITQLQQADVMWTAMEDLYKKRLSELEANQAITLAKENDVRNSLVKWRTQNQRKVAEMEELRAITIDYEERAKEKQREEARNKQDAQTMKKQMEAVQKEVEKVQAEITRIKKVSQSTKVDLDSQISKLEKEVAEEKTRRVALVEEGRGSTAHARDKLATACRVLLQLRLEVEERRTEEQTINMDIEVMNESMETCSDRCKAKVQLIRNEIELVNKNIAKYELRCAQCHQGCSTGDVRKLCSDCPRCRREVRCLHLDPTHCGADATSSCVCHPVKEKLVENILENMFNILEADVKKNGDTLADEVLESLNKSTNGKLTNATRDRLHEYVIRTVEDNLDMCVMGGAMKTRCEMDPETRKQLDLCLKEIEEAPPPEHEAVDKGDSEKDSDKKGKGERDFIKLDSDKKAAACWRWGGALTCHCARGPDDCACTRAPPVPAAPRPCGTRHVTTHTSKSSMSSRVAPTCCTCGDPATRDTDAPLSCYCGRSGVCTPSRSAGGGVAGGGAPPHQPAAPACKPLCHCGESGVNTPKKVSLTGFNPIKGGQTPKKHDCSHKNSPYPSHASSKQSASSSRTSPGLRSKTSTRSSVTSMETRDPHGFFCSLLSHLSTSLHSFFHPPRYPDDAANGRARKDTASKNRGSALNALKVVTSPSKKSKPLTPITNAEAPTPIQVLASANVSHLPFKVALSKLKTEPELKVELSSAPNDDPPTRYSPASGQEQLLESPNVKSLRYIIIPKKEDSTTSSKTISSRKKSSEAIISSNRLSSRHSASSMMDSSDDNKGLIPNVSVEPLTSAAFDRPAKIQPIFQKGSHPKLPPFTAATSDRDAPPIVSIEPQYKPLEELNRLGEKVSLGKILCAKKSISSQIIFQTDTFEVIASDAETENLARSQVMTLLPDDRQFDILLKPTTESHKRQNVNEIILPLHKNCKRDGEFSQLDYPKMFSRNHRTRSKLIFDYCNIEQEKKVKTNSTNKSPEKEECDCVGDSSQGLTPYGICVKEGMKGTLKEKIKMIMQGSAPYSNDETVRKKNYKVCLKDQPRAIFKHRTQNVCTSVDLLGKSYDKKTKKCRCFNQKQTTRNSYKSMEIPAIFVQKEHNYKYNKKYESKDEVVRLNTPKRKTRVIDVNEPASRTFCEVTDRTLKVETEATPYFKLFHSEMKQQLPHFLNNQILKKPRLI